MYHSKQLQCRMDTRITTRKVIPLRHLPVKASAPEARLIPDRRITSIGQYQHRLVCTWALKTTRLCAYKRQGLLTAAPVVADYGRCAPSWGPDLTSADPISKYAVRPVHGIKSVSAMRFSPNVVDDVFRFRSKSDRDARAKQD